MSQLQIVLYFNGLPTSNFYAFLLTTSQNIASCSNIVPQTPTIRKIRSHGAVIEEMRKNSAYRTEDGHPWVLPVVSEAERRMTTDERYNHEYLPILGDQRYCQAATTLLLGEKSPAIADGRVSYEIRYLEHMGYCRRRAFSACRGLVHCASAPNF
jgi:hypothetical protein